MNRINKVNFAFLITVLLSLLGSLCFSLIPVIRQNYLAGLLISQILYVLPAAGYLAGTKGDVKELLRIHRVKIPNVILLVLFAYFITPLLTLLNAISLLFSTNTISNTVSGIVEAYPIFISLGAIAFVPAVLEESVYRGVFFNEYRKIDPRKGIILSGLLFGLMHMNFNQFFYAFIMGMIFAVVVEVTDSIISSMIVHCVINGTSVLMTYILPKLMELAGSSKEGAMLLETMPEAVKLSPEELVPIIILYGVIAIFTTAVAFLLLMGMAQIAGRKGVLKNIVKKNPEKENKRIINIPLAAGIAICLVLMVYTEWI